MPKVAQAGDFFVVGGPVQPDRACYVERAADAELARGIAEQRFCYVLAARSTGKSSLVARAIRALRRDGQLAAVVDLSQIGVRGESGDAARWYYGIAYRVLRELRLKIDLQSWWQEKSALPGEQRLAEFFSDIVLTRTAVSVTVFIDEIERTTALSFAQDLFATIHACYARRVSEPEYARLNFVVLGVAAPGRLCPDPGISPFIDGLAIEPADFTLEQSLTLAAGFGAEADDGHELMKRIHAWSGGQPYVTQRVARGVARKGGRLADVDRVVREQFLAPGAADKDPYLNRIRMELTRGGQRQRQALALLGRLARGVPVADEAASQGRELLRLAGVTVRGVDGSLHYRNRILRSVFDDRWISSIRPFDWRGAGAAAALVAAAVAVTLWYSQILPRPYIRTLSVVTQDLAIAQDAYEKLHRLPGFADMADRLLAEAMVRRSREARAFAEMRAADEVLRQLPGQALLADQLRADYWLRRAVAATHEERRDEALLLAARAAALGDAHARRVADELIDDDYAGLAATFRFSGSPRGWAVDWEDGELAVVDSAQRVRRVALDAADAAVPAPIQARLTSLQHVPVQREIGVDESGSAGAFRLRARIRHARPGDLSFVLTAPDGGEARLALDTSAAEPEAAVPARGAHAAEPEDARSARDVSAAEPEDARSARDVSTAEPEDARSARDVSTAGPEDAPVARDARAAGRVYEFRADGGSPLAALADRSRAGVWRLTIVDRRSGAAGALTDWSLTFASDHVWRDTPEQGLAIPDPTRVEQVDVVISADGRLAAAYPAREGAVGGLAVWDVADARALHDLDLAGRPEHVMFNAAGTRLLVQTGGRAVLWDVRSGERIAVIDADGELASRPAFSVDGEFVALAERGPDEAHRLKLVRAGDGTVTAAVEGIAGARDWVLGPEARYAASVEPGGRIVTVLDPRSGRTIRVLRHEHDVRRLIAVPKGDSMLTIDDLGDVRAWRIPIDASRASSEESARIGATVDAGSVGVSADGSLVAFEGPRAQVVVRSIAGDPVSARFRTGAAPGGVATRLSPAGDALVTAEGGRFRLWRVDVEPAGERADPNVSALAIDTGGGVAALGFRGGHVRVRSASELALHEPRRDAIDFIGHRGRVTALAINAHRALIASGGENGVVRTWDLASVAPTEHFMRHPAGPVRDVDISPDGRWIASASEYFARVWRSRDGAPASELTVNGTAVTVAFSHDSARWAVGDSAGNVFVSVPGEPSPLGSVRAQGGVSAIAFSPDGSLLASGDETGHVELWDASTFSPIVPRYRFAHPIRWVAFAASGDLLIQTDAWLHRAGVVQGRLRVAASRLLPIGVAAGAAVAPDGERQVRLVGGLAGANVDFHDVSIDAPPAASPSSPVDGALERDWSAALGLTIDANGEVEEIVH